MPSPAPSGCFEAFFASPPAGGQRLCIHVAPKGPARGAIVQVHAFGEEMNKMRRMSALAARALAAQGFAVLQIDLQGCGDASGDFADASWSGWLSDIAWATHWLRQRHPAAPLWLWGQRAGALLAGTAVDAIDAPCGLLLWNPVLQGKAVMQQLVRLKAAGEWASGEGKAVAAWAKAELAAGRAIEIAGYTLDPALAQALEAAMLQPPGRAGRVAWLEVAGRDGEPSLSPAAQAQLPRWQAAGHVVHAQAVRGPAFWQTVEIEDAPELVAATVEALLTLEPVAP